MRNRKIARFVLLIRCGADIRLYRNCENSRKRKLRELYRYTALLNAGQPPQLQDWLTGDDPTDEPERRFLDENDITRCV